MTARNSPADKPPARKSAAGKTPSTRKNSKAAKAVAVVEAGETISNLVLDFVGNVPGTFEPASGQP
ncbi:MAG: hypothetical protein WAV67_03430, partial [Dokdonella sp.]